MKKLITVVAGLFFALSAYADDYQYMEFTNSDGSIHTLAVEGLEMTISKGNLMMTNSQGEALSIPIESLASMQFTNTTSVGIVADNADSVISLYTVDGVRVGDFHSLKEASSEVCTGIYIVKDSKGRTFKIALGK